MFPNNFDINYYKEKNKDLKTISEQNLIKHYNDYGLKEGRVCSIGQTREYYKNINNKFNSCLEIGPFDTPIIKGNNVKYFDVLNKNELINRAKKIGRTANINNIPYINFVSEKCDLTTINENFDLILSCHSIEHQIDLIKHFKDIYNLLNKDGYYIIIMPDKRYCFDYFIKESSIADILDAHLNNNINNHKFKSVFEHRVLTCHNDSLKHWQNIHGEQKIDITIIKNTINEYLLAQQNNEYIDVHAWQFTPDSFKKNVEILNQIGYINLKIDKIYNTVYGSNEFIAILQK